MYVNVEGAIGKKIYLSIISPNSQSKAFNIKVTQLAENLAPPNCLQWIQTSNGFFSSFNYEDRARIVQKVRPSYFVSLSYLS